MRSQLGDGLVLCSRRILGKLYLLATDKLSEQTGSTTTQSIRWRFAGFLHCVIQKKVAVYFR